MNEIKRILRVKILLVLSSIIHMSDTQNGRTASEAVFNLIKAYDLAKEIREENSND